MISQTQKAAERKIMNKKKKRLIFYIAVIALPVLQFAIFYLYVNFNSVILAFQKYIPPAEGEVGFKKVFANFDNFKVAFATLANGWNMIANSLRMIACELFIGLPLALLFSFYVYKKFFLSGLFKVMLFMPQIISSIIFVMLFRYIANDVYPAVFKTEWGLLSSPTFGTRMGTILFYNIWISFGVNVMMFTGAMTAIDESIVEAAQLDGANLAQEFIHVTLPMIWSTFSTFVVISLTGLFTHQLSLFAFFSDGAAELSSFGYYLYVASTKKILIEEPGLKWLTYSQLSALGIVLTAITLPIVLGTRKIMSKFGPSAD